MLAMVLVPLLAIMTGLQGCGPEATPCDANLFRVRVGFVYGYVDSCGVERVAPRYDSASEFHEGLAIACVGSECSILNAAGDVLLTSHLWRGASVDGFCEGRAVIQGEHGRYGYVDRSGEVVIEPRFQFARSFHYGAAAVMLDGRWGFVGLDGDWLIEPEFREVQDFSEGLAAARGQAWGYVDRQGVAIQPKFDVAGPFSEGLAPVKSAGLWSFINRSGHSVIELPFASGAGIFREGLAVVFSNDRAGYVDKSGRMAIQAKFEKASSFSEGLAAVKLNGLYGYINGIGETVIQPQFITASSFFGGRALVTTGVSLINLPPTQMIIDKEGHVKWRPRGQQSP